jgi:hypothetical protein
MHLPAGFLASLGLGLDEALTIHLVQEKVLTSFSTAHGVIQNVRIFNP